MLCNTNSYTAIACDTDDAPKGQGSWQLGVQDMLYTAGDLDGQVVMVNLSTCFAMEVDQASDRRCWLRRCSAVGEDSDAADDDRWLGVPLANALDGPGVRGASLCVRHAEGIGRRCAVILSIMQQEGESEAGGRPYEVTWHRDWFTYVPRASFGVHLSDSGQIHLWGDGDHTRLGGDKYGTVHRNWRPLDEISLIVEWETREWSLYLNRIPLHKCALPEFCEEGKQLRGTVWMCEQDSLVCCTMVPTVPRMNYLQRFWWWSSAQAHKCGRAAGEAADGAKQLAKAGVVRLLPRSVGDCLSQGHERLIFDVCFDLEGQTMFTASADDLVKAWDLQEGFCKWTLNGGGTVSALAYSPGTDGTPARLFLGMHRSKDNICEYLFPTDGDAVSADGCPEFSRTLPGHRHNVSRLIVQAGGVLYSTGDRVPRRWELDADSRRTISLAFRGHEHIVHDIALDRDRRWLATASQDGSAMIFDALCAAPLAAVRPHVLERTKLTSVAFSSDGVLFVGTGGGAIVKYRAETYSEKASDTNCIMEVVEPAADTKRSEQTKQLSTGSKTSAKWSSNWQVRLGNKWEDLEETLDVALKEAFLQGDPSVTVSVQGADYTFDLDNLKQENLQTGRQRNIRRPVNAHAVRTAVRVEMTDLLQLVEEARLVGHSKGGSVRRLVTVDYRPDEEAEEDAARRPSGSPAPELRSSPSTKFSTTSVDSSWLLSTASDGMVKIWSVQSHECLHTIVGHIKAVRCCAALPDGTVITAGDDHVARLWAQLRLGDTNRCWRKAAIEFRSADLMELLATPLTWFLTLGQLAYLPHESHLRNMGLSLNMFRLRVYLSLVVMAYGVVQFLADIYQRMDKSHAELLCNPAFSDDVELEKLAESREKKRTMAWVASYCLSTLLVVPLCKGAALVLDCQCIEHGDGDTENVKGLVWCYMSGTASSLARAPMKCLEGEHLWMLAMSIVMTPLFALCLWPVGLAGGDASLLATTDESGTCRRVGYKLSPSTWNRLAGRRRHLATGALSRKPGKGLRFEAALMLAKLAMGIAASALTADRWGFNALHDITALIIFAVSVCCSPVKYPKFVCVLRLACFGNLLAGLSADWIYAGEPGRDEAAEWLERVQE